MGRDIHLDGVPDKAAEAFEAYANTEFDGDKSMALRELIVREKLRSDVRGVEASLSERIQKLEKRVNELEDSDDDKEVRTVG